MMYTEKNWIKAITKLIEFTSSGEVAWDVFVGYTKDVQIEIDACYYTERDDLFYVVKSSRFKNFVDDDEWYWNSLLEFEVYKSSGYKEYVRIAKAPSLNVISTLYDVVENHFAFKEGALKGLLS